jgi:hypothetical protein
VKGSKEIVDKAVSFACTKGSVLWWEERMTTQKILEKHLIPILLDRTIADPGRARDVILGRLECIYGKNITLSQLEWKPYVRSVSLYVTNETNTMEHISHQEILDEEAYIASMVRKVRTPYWMLQMLSFVLAVVTLLLCVLAK